MSVKEQYWRYSLIAIIIVLGIVLFQQITPFLGGLLGALTIYILVRKQMIRLTTKRKMKRSTAALLITTEAVFFFLIPISLVVWMLVDKLQNLNLDPQSIIAPIEEIAGIIKSKTGYDVLGSDTTSFIVSALPRIGRDQQLCRQSVRTGLRFVFHADRRYKDGSICQCHPAF